MASNKNIFLISAVSFLFLALAGFIFAANNLEINYPELGGIKPETTSIGLPDYVNYIFNFSVGLSGLIASLLFIYGGVRYLTSAGNPVIRRDAISRISSAVLGLAVILFSYVILTTINPQLIFLNFKAEQLEQCDCQAPQTTLSLFCEKVCYAAEAPVAEKAKKVFQEVPIGSLANNYFSSYEGILDNKRWERVKEILDNTKLAAGKVKVVSNQLKEPVISSSCGGLSADCAAGYSCSGGQCYGNPCPQKGLIEQTRTNFRKELDELKSQQKKFAEEINSSTERVGVREVLGELEKAEETLVTCDYGIYNYQDFLNYKESFNDSETFVIEKKEWEDKEGRTISGAGDDATFYCGLLNPPQETSGIFQKSLSFVSNIFYNQKREVFAQASLTCEEEIPIGEAIDETQEFARAILIELNSMNNVFLSNIALAEDLYQTTNPEGRCTASNCAPSIGCREQCIACPIEEEGGGEGFNPFFLPNIFAQQQQECCPLRCLSAVGPCKGNIFNNTKVINLIGQVDSNYLQIEAAVQKLKDLIDEKNVSDKFKKTEIIEKLDKARTLSGQCFNKEATYEKLKAENEGVILDYFFSCQKLKEEDVIKECYGGRDGGNPKRADNYFCCY